MNFGLLIIALIGGTVGILSTVYLLFSFPAVLLWKNLPKGYERDSTYKIDVYTLYNAKLL